MLGQRSITVQRNTTGRIEPTAVSDIMRAKASLAVAEITKKKSSLLASAFVAASIAVGCQNPTAPIEEKKDYSTWEPNGIEYIEPAPAQQTKQSEEGCVAYLFGETQYDCSGFDTYMGDVLINECVDNIGNWGAQIGYFPVYSKNGWNVGRCTDLVIKMPNVNLYSDCETLDRLMEGMRVYKPAGYELPISEGASFIPATTSVKEPERRVPQSNGMGL